MTRKYVYQDAARAAGILKALLPTGLDCSVSLVRDGWEARVTVCGQTGCETFDFNLGLTDHHLVDLADCWKTGSYVRPAGQQSTALNAMRSLSVETPEQMIAWARSARKGEKVIYFRGELAQFRFDAPRKIRDKSDLLDRIKSKNKKDADVARLRTEVRQLEDQNQLLVAVERLREASVIVLMQLRLTDGSGCVYFAVKK